MLELGDLDFYYLIICSRGPGSETITVTKLDETETEIELLETSEDEFNKFGVCEATTNFNDEGPVIAVPFGTMPLAAIYEWLKYDYARNEQHLEPLNIPGMSDETRAMVEGIEATRLATRQAYMSACIRVFLSSDIGMGNNPWTSVNGWRQVDIELPNKAQFEALMEATGETAEQLGQWNCAVLKEAAKRYLEGTLPEKEFRGC